MLTLLLFDKVRCDSRRMMDTRSSRHMMGLCHCLPWQVYFWNGTISIIQNMPFVVKWIKAYNNNKTKMPYVVHWNQHRLRVKQLSEWKSNLYPKPTNTWGHSLTSHRMYRHKLFVLSHLTNRHYLYICTITNLNSNAGN